MVLSSLMSKKGQIWGMDLMIAGIIFTVALTFFYIYSINEGEDIEETIQTLSYEGRSITNYLLSPGYPENWDTSNVIELGILSDDRINETKLEAFYDLAQSDYAKTQAIFGILNDYYFFLDRDMIINSLPVDGIGKSGVNRNTISARNLIKVERVTIYKDRPIGATLYIWEN